MTPPQFDEGGAFALDHDAEPTDAQPLPGVSRVSAEHGPTDALTDDDVERLTEEAADREADLAARLHEQRRAAAQGRIAGHTPAVLAQLLARRLRETKNTSLAELVAVEDYTALSEENKARLDALVYGVGYLHDGKRLDPSTVRTYTPPIYQRDQ